MALRVLEQDQKIGGVFTVLHSSPCMCLTYMEWKKWSMIPCCSLHVPRGFWPPRRSSHSSDDQHTWRSSAPRADKDWQPIQINCLQCLQVRMCISGQKCSRNTLQHHAPEVRSVIKVKGLPQSSEVHWITISFRFLSLLEYSKTTVWVSNITTYRHAQINRLGI